MSNLPQQTTIIQYVADGISTVYVYPFYIFQNPDTTYTINVYVTQPGAVADPTTDLQPQLTAYTVQGSGNFNGGTITFQTGYIPVNGAIVTISRYVMNAIDTQFSVASNISGTNLDMAFLIVMLCIQQNTSYIQERTLRYAIDAFLPSTTNNILPVLTNINNQVWTSLNGNIVAALLEEGAGFSALRAQLLLATSTIDGASIVGYYNHILNTATTVDAMLTSINTQIAVLQQDFVFYGASAYLSANQTINATLTVTVGFNTVDFDPNGLFIPGDNGYKIQKAGYYRCNGIVLASTTTSSPTTSAILYLTQNGTQMKVLSEEDQGQAFLTLSGSAIILCAVNDIITLQYANSDPTHSNIIEGTQVFTTFDIEFVGVA